MRIVVRETRQLLSVGTSFFRLIETLPTSTRVRLGYTIDQHEALKRGFTQVRITAYTSREHSREITELTRKGDGTELIENILLNHQRLRETAKKNSENVILQYNSDITKKLNNTKLSAILSDKLDSKVLKRTIKATPRRENKHAVSGQNGLAVLPIPDRTTQFLGLKLITDDCVDPSDVTSVGQQITPVHDMIDGINHRPTTKTPRLLDYLKSVVAASSPVDARADVEYTYELEETHLIDIFDEVEFPTKIDNFSEIYFSFELIDSLGVSVNTVVKKLRTERELNVFRAPKKPPVVSIKYGQLPGKGLIQVAQIDPNGKSVQIYRRTLNHAAPIELEKYVLIQESPLTTADGFVLIEVDIDSASTTIFQVVPLGEQDAVGAEFTSVVLPPNDEITRFLSDRETVSSRRFVHVSVTSRIVPSGVSIDVRSLPYDTISVHLLRRDITANENVMSLIDTISTVGHRDVYTFIDTTVSSTRVYEYACSLVFSDGTSDRSGTEILEYTPLSTQLVDTRIEELQITTNDVGYNVAFNITSKLVPTTLQSIKQALQSQDILKYFDADILKERDKLQSMIAHTVNRINLTTGEKESFGVVTSESFSDIDFGPGNSVKSLSQGNVYRYEVITLIRQPETMFSEFEKTTKDDLSKREYTFRPGKFLHPVTLTKGNIVSEKSLAANHSKEAFSFGETGSVVSVDVNLTQPVATIIELKAGQVNTDTVEISWKLTGNVDSIDHFLIAKSTLDGREIVGKSHTHHENGEFYFMHVLQRHDMGEITYVIIPILSDYNKGTEAVSNKIFVDTAESHFISKSTRVAVRGIELRK